MASPEALQKEFAQLVARDRLAHGYIIFGEDEVVTGAFSKKLARFLETKKWDIEATLIDSQVVDGNEAGIDVVRDITSFLWQKPLVSSRKTCVIERADALTPLAQQAILKISEEPPEEGLIILTVKDPTALLAPLASRFQKIYIIDPKAKKRVYTKEIREVVSGLLAITGQRERREYIKMLFEDDTFDLGELMEALLDSLRKDIRKNASLIRALLERWQYINQFNTNKKLQLEAAFLEGGS